jgi:hypothetical protein
MTTNLIHRRRRRTQEEGWGGFGMGEWHTTYHVQSRCENVVTVSRNE